MASPRQQQGPALQKQVEFLASWLNYACGGQRAWVPVPVDAFFEALRDGVVLCTVVGALAPRAELLGRVRPKAAATCIATLDAALSVVWQLSPCSQDMCRARDFFDCRRPAVVRCLLAVFEVLHIRGREVRLRSRDALGWMDRRLQEQFWIRADPLPEAILADPWAAPRDVLELFGDGRLLAALQKGSLHRLPELVERAAELACSLAGCSGRSSRSLDLMLFSLHLAWQHASDETYETTYGDMPHVSPEEELSHLSWFLQQRFDSAESAYAFMVGRHGWGTSTSSCLTRSSFFGALRAKNFTGVLRLAWDAFAPSTPTYMTWEEFSARIGFGSVVASPGDAAGAGDWQVLSEMPRNSCFRGALEERQLLLAEDRRRLAELRQGGGAEAAEAAAVAAALAATAARGAEEPCPVASGLPADPTTSIAARLVVPLPAARDAGRARREGLSEDPARCPGLLEAASAAGELDARLLEAHGRATALLPCVLQTDVTWAPGGGAAEDLLVLDVLVPERRAPPDGRWPARGGRLAMRIDASKISSVACAESGDGRCWTFVVSLPPEAVLFSSEGLPALDDADAARVEELGLGRHMRPDRWCEEPLPGALALRACAGPSRDQRREAARFFDELRLLGHFAREAQAGR